MTSKKIALTAIYAALLIVQEQILVFIPNFSFTFILLFLFFKNNDYISSIALIITYVLGDYLLSGTFNLVYIFGITIGIILAMFVVKTKINKIISMTIFSLIYTFTYLLISVVLFNYSFLPYLLADVPFTLILICSNILLLVWVYEPLQKVYTKIQSNN